MKSLKIGILTDGFREWSGGIDFLRMICTSLLAAEPNLKIELIVENKSVKRKFTMRRFLKGLIGKPSRSLGDQHDRAFFETQFVNDVTDRITVCDLVVSLKKSENDLVAKNFDVLLPSLLALPANFSIPWVGYIYDFQHKYFPQFFENIECSRRDEQFRQTLSNAAAVIVNAKAVANDVEKFHGQVNARVFNLPFSAPQRSSGAQKLPSSIAEKFGLTQAYFIICNQFWLHKDHLTAFYAFQKLALSNASIDLVCTGNTLDHRDPSYFERLKDYLRDNNLSSRVHIVGLIEKPDQVALLRGAIGLVQPTLFEGGPGGGAVYEALSYGVQSIVSDIDVNREIDSPLVHFFKAQDSDGLRNAMITVLEQPSKTEENGVNRESANQSRRVACGNEILVAIAFAIEKHRAKQMTM
jgi:glycosyltransferase involved in cell wall biosynthesis